MENWKNSRSESEMMKLNKEDNLVKQPSENSTDRLLSMLPGIVFDLESTLKSKDFSKMMGLKIDRREPHTLRLFYFKDGLRVCLHIFQPCKWEDAFPHPHSWNSEILILEGKYKHWISDYTELDKKADTNLGFTHTLGEGSSYAIKTPYVWHKVQPLTEVMTIMINEKEWVEKSIWCVTTRGKELTELTDLEKESIILRFLNKLKTLK